jgi:hypothetical protein
MSRLMQLGNEYDTDKLGHGYLTHYEDRFGPFCQRPMNILEIGIMGGASLRMWRDFFAYGKVYGIDVEQVSVEGVTGEDRIKAFCGPQEDVDFLQTVVQETGPLDVVIDDGSHKGVHHVISFEALWPHVKDGGWYCIEDCQSMFNICWTQPGQRTMIDVLTERWPAILTGRDTIREVALVGNFIYSGLILMRKDFVRADAVPLGT